MYRLYYWLGAFALPGLLFLDMGLINSIVGLLLGALFIIIIATNYFKLSQMFPQTGGEFLYTLHFLEKNMDLFVDGF